MVNSGDGRTWIGDFPTGPAPVDTTGWPAFRAGHTVFDERMDLEMHRMLARTVIGMAVAATVLTGVAAPASATTGVNCGVAYATMQFWRTMSNIFISQGDTSAALEANAEFAVAADRYYTFC
jgi:hypothetical protein